MKFMAEGHALRGRRRINGDIRQQIGRYAILRKVGRRFVCRAVCFFGKEGPSRIPWRLRSRLCLPTWLEPLMPRTWHRQCALTSDIQYAYDRNLAYEVSHPRRRFSACSHRPEIIQVFCRTAFSCRYKSRPDVKSPNSRRRGLYRALGRKTNHFDPVSSVL